MIVLGIDWGEKTIGLAISDDSGRCALPRAPIEAKSRKGDSPKDQLYQLRGIIRQEKVAIVVMGLPLNMDGSEGEQAQRAKKIAAELFIPWPSGWSRPELVFWDERLSSQAVNRAMLEGNLSRRKRAKRDDSLAAAWMLQSYLDAQRPSMSPEAES